VSNEEYQPEVSGEAIEQYNSIQRDRQKAYIKGATDNQKQIIGGNEVALCGLFDPDTATSSATKCKCGREKWEHPKPKQGKGYHKLSCPNNDKKPVKIGVDIKPKQRR